MKRLLLLIPLVSLAVLADVGLKQATTALGPVRDLSCKSDGGLICSRDADSQIGGIQCVGATATEAGCVTPSSQTFAGDKTFTGDPRIVGHVHASLTACDVSHKGTWQTCTTHNSPVFCNGSANYELLGSTSYVTLPPIYVNGLLGAHLFYLSSWQLPYAYTITNVSGFIAPGAGTTQTLRFSDGSNNCDCPIDCTTGGVIFTCTGNCTYAASAQVIPFIYSDGCTTPTTVKGLLVAAGYR